MTTTTTATTATTAARSTVSPGVRAIIEGVLTGIREDIAALEFDLAAPVLDGTPWATIVEMPAPVGPAILGEWTDLDGTVKRGFRSLSVMPWHFCGAILSDGERSARKLAVLAERGQVGIARHIRDLKAEKLAALRAHLPELEAQFAALCA